MFNREAALTPLTHGSKGNPHPQYDTIKSYESTVDNSGLPWLKLFELEIASPDLQISDTIQRIFFGFKVFDNASDSDFSIAEFNGYIGMSGTTLFVQGTKQFVHEQYQNANNAKLNLHLYWLNHDNPLTWTVKAYLEMPWNYKRAVIMQPWINIPHDRYVTTPTNPLMAKITQREKTDNLFSDITGNSFISGDDKALDVKGFTDYQCRYNDLNTHTTNLMLNGMMLTCARIGNIVSYSLHGQTTNTMVNGASIGTIPAGYRPASTVGLVAYRYDSSNTISPFSISPGGAVVMIGADVPANKVMYGGVSTATMDSMPIDGGV